MREVQDAAERVLEAMRALDAHRHEGAPTLERAYRRALEAYFMAAEHALGRDPVPDDEEDDGASALRAARSTSEEADAARAEDFHGQRAAIEGHFAAARRALRLAREYRQELGTSGRRERECIEAAHAAPRRGPRASPEDAPPARAAGSPGLAKTKPGEESQRVARAG